MQLETTCSISERVASRSMRLEQFNLFSDVLGLFNGKGLEEIFYIL